MYAPSGAPQPVVGTGSWQQTSTASGILAITYRNVGFVNHLYYSITWVNADTIVLADPSFRLTMTPRPSAWRLDGHRRSSRSLGKQGGTLPECLVPEEGTGDSADVLDEIGRDTLPHPVAAG